MLKSLLQIKYLKNELQIILFGDILEHQNV